MNLSRAILVMSSLCFAVSNFASASNSFEEFDSTPFKQYGAVENLDLIKQNVETESGRVSVLRSREIKENRPSVVLLHNNSGCKELFIKLMSCLDRRCNVFALDLPGHGESSNASNMAETYSFQGYAKAIVQATDEMSVPKFTAVGWSLGGHVAMEIQNLFPDKINGVVLTGSPAMPLGKTASFWAFNVFRMIWKGVLPMIGQQTQFTETEAQFFMDSGGVHDNNPFFIRAAMRTDGNARATMHSNTMNGVGVCDQQRLLQSSEIPVGIVIGRNDAGVNADFIRSGCKTYKNATVIELDTDHGTVWNEPKAFAAYVLGFINLNSQLTN